MQKIAVFGGTFNPIHNGHIETAKFFARTLNFNRTVFVPTNIPPHKSAAGIAPAAHRLKMCALAVDGIEGFEVSGVEIARAGKSYTVDTLNFFKKRYPEAEMYLIMGADMFLTLQDWKAPEEIFRLATICTVPRDENNYLKLKTHAERLSRRGLRSVVADTARIPISSTQIRNSFKNQQDVSSMIPDEVFAYILAHKLYQE